MADSRDHANEALFPYQEEMFSIPLATTIFQEDICSMSKLATLDVASHISPWADGYVYVYVFSNGPKTPVVLTHSFNQQESGLPPRKYKRSECEADYSTSSNAVLKIALICSLMLHTSSQVDMDLWFDVCVYCRREHKFLE